MNSIAAAVCEKLFGDSQDYLSRSLSLLKREREWLSLKLGAFRALNHTPVILILSLLTLMNLD